MKQKVPLRLKKGDLARGDKVQLLVAIEPYYSGRAGNPKVVIPAGAEGIVGSVDVPQTIQRRDRTTGRLIPAPDFNCVDFILPDVFQGDPKHGNNQWRCAVHYHEMCLVERADPLGQSDTTSELVG